MSARQRRSSDPLVPFAKYQNMPFSLRGSNPTGIRNYGQRRIRKRISRHFASEGYPTLLSMSSSTTHNRLELEKVINLPLLIPPYFLSLIIAHPMSHSSKPSRKNATTSTRASKCQILPVMSLPRLSPPSLPPPHLQPQPPHSTTIPPLAFRTLPTSHQHPANNEEEV